jgi:hypothetical protein
MGAAQHRWILRRCAGRLCLFGSSRWELDLDLASRCEWRCLDIPQQLLKKRFACVLTGHSSGRRNYVLFCGGAPRDMSHKVPSLRDPDTLCETPLWAYFVEESAFSPSGGHVPLGRACAQLPFVAAGSCLAGASLRCMGECCGPRIRRQPSALSGAAQRRRWLAR